MSYEPLHHKYRPQTFGQLVGQEAIATTLTNAIRSQRIAPAYLFTGPRGTGKTSSARILAKSLNCLTSSVPTENPCGQCDVCQGIVQGRTLDVIEIDAASNTGVDNIRDLIERAQFAPVQCRYKVYVIDECHMLSTAAFNSLLKTLEEPPERVVFVLATTDPQRVLPTIISRCQRFDFRRIPLESMTQHLKNIAIKEEIKITDEAVLLVAQIAQGGLRDAESLLDQLSLLPEQITVEKVWDLVGAVPEHDLMSLLEALDENNPQTVIDHTRHLMDRGREPLVVLQNLASFYRDLLIAKNAPNRSDLVTLTTPTWQKLCQFSQKWEMDIIIAGQKHLQSSELQIKNTTQPRLWLEVTLLGLFPSVLRPPAPVVIEEAKKVSSSPSSISSPPVNYSPPSFPVNTPVESVNSVRENRTSPVTTSPVIIEANLDNNLGEVWQQVLVYVQPLGTQQLFKQHGKLLEITENVVRISMKSSPLLKMAKDKISNVESAFQQVFNRPLKVNLEGPVSGENHPIQFPEFPQQNSPPSSSPKPPLSPPPPEEKSVSNHLVTLPPVLPENPPSSPPLAENGIKKNALSLSEKIKQFADFFEGEILDLPALKFVLKSEDLSLETPFQFPDSASFPSEVSWEETLMDDSEEGED